MEKYKVVDVCEGREILGYTSNLNTVKSMARKRIVDTDGECSIEIRQLNPASNKYGFLKMLKTC